VGGAHFLGVWVEGAQNFWPSFTNLSSGVGGFEGSGMRSVRESSSSAAAYSSPTPTKNSYQIFTFRMDPTGQLRGVRTPGALWPAMPLNLSRRRSSGKVWWLSTERPRGLGGGDKASKERRSKRRKQNRIGCRAEEHRDLHVMRTGVQVHKWIVRDPDAVVVETDRALWCPSLAGCIRQVDNFI